MQQLEKELQGKEGGGGQRETSMVDGSVVYFLLEGPGASKKVNGCE